MATAGRIGDVALASAPELLAATALCARVSELDSVHTCERAVDRGACAAGSNRWPHLRSRSGITPARPQGLSELLDYCREGQPLHSFVTSPGDRRERFRAWERLVLETEQLADTLASGCRASSGPCEAGCDPADQECVWLDGRFRVVPDSVSEPRMLDATDIAPLTTVGGSEGGTGRRDLGGSLETVVAGIASVVEERAHQEIQLYLATRMHDLLGCGQLDDAALCPEDPRALLPAHFLRSSCAVLRSWSASSGALGSMSWSALGQALEADLSALPSSLTCVVRGGEAGVEQSVLAWARFLLHVIAALRDGIDPALFASRLAERLEREADDLPREARIATLVFVAVTRLPELGRVPPSALVGLTRTLALEATSAALDEALVSRIDVDGLAASVAALTDTAVTSAMRPRLATDVRARLLRLAVCGDGESAVFDLPRVRALDGAALDAANRTAACDELTAAMRDGSQGVDASRLEPIITAARDARTAATMHLREATVNMERVVQALVDRPDRIDWAALANTVERLDAMGGGSDAGRALAALLGLMGSHGLAFDSATLRTLAESTPAVIVLSQAIAGLSGATDVSAWAGQTRTRVNTALACTTPASEACAAADSFVDHAVIMAPVLAALRRAHSVPDCATSRTCGDDGVMHGWMGAVCFQAATARLSQTTYTLDQSGPLTPAQAKDRLRRALDDGWSDVAAAIADQEPPANAAMLRQLFECVARARPDRAWVDTGAATLAAAFNPSVAPSEQLVRTLVGEVLGGLWGRVCQGDSCEQGSARVRELVEAIADARSAAEALGDADIASEARAGHIGALATAVVRAVVAAVSVARTLGGAEPGGVELVVPDALPRLVEAIVARDGARILSQSLALVADIGAQIVERNVARVDVQLCVPQALGWPCHTAGPEWETTRRALHDAVQTAIRAQPSPRGPPLSGHLSVPLNVAANGTVTTATASASHRDLDAIATALSSANLPHVATASGSRSLLATVRFSPPGVLEAVPGQVVRALAFGAELTGAETSEDVANIVNEFAAPVGSYQSKRFRRGVYITALVGGVAGGEWYPSRSRDTLPEAGFAFGWHVSLGFDFVLASAPDWGSLGLYVPVINLAPFTTFAPGGEQDLPSLEGLSLLSPGFFLRYEIGDSPFVIAGGLNYTPQLRRYDYLATNGEQRAEHLDAVQAVLLLAVDVTLFGF